MPDMFDKKSPEFEALLQAEVERAIAPHVGVASPVILAKLRELADRYYREHPQASRVLELLAYDSRITSGKIATGSQEAADDAKKHSA